MPDILTPTTWTIIGIVAGVLLITLVILSMWKKVPQDKAAVVTGLRKRVITGGGGLVIPLFERIDQISLENIKLDIGTKGAMTSEGVPIITDGVAVIKIKNEHSAILAAIEQFNTTKESQTTEIIKETAKDVLEGKLREIISKLTVDDIYKNREKFASEVQEVAATDLLEMGLEIKAFTIRDIDDENGYLKSLGIKRIAEVKKDAAIAQAIAERETMEKTSEARRAGETAKLLAETQIAEATKEKSLKVLAYEQEQQTSKARTDMAYDIQHNVTSKEVIGTQMDAEVLKQQRMKDVAVEQVQINIATEERNIELAKRKAERKKAELVETVVNPSEAEKEKQRIEAEGEKQRAILEAEAEAAAKKLSAQAESEKIRMLAEAEANSIKLKGSAEAEVISATGRAEAEKIRLAGIAEAEGMEKKAEAYAKYNQAAVTQMIIEKLPEIAAAIAAPMSQIDKITIIGGGDSQNDGISSVSGTVTKTLSSVIESVRETTGFDITEAMKAKTISAQTDRNINIDVTSNGEKLSPAVESQIIKTAVEEVKPQISENTKTNETNE